jgi:hypothetical protein
MFYRFLYGKEHACMMVPKDSARHPLRNGVLALFCLAIGLPGCESSTSGDGAIAAKDPKAASRRREMEDFYAKNKKKQAPPGQAARQH